MESLLHRKRDQSDFDFSGDEYFSESDVERFSDFDVPQATKDYFLSKQYLRSIQMMHIARSSENRSTMEMDVSQTSRMHCVPLLDQVAALADNNYISRQVWRRVCRNIIMGVCLGF